MKRAAGGRGLVQLLIVLAILAIAIALAVPAIDRARDRASLVLCADHLRAIGVQLGNYEKLYGGALPLSATVDCPAPGILESLRAARCAINPSDFYCPAEKNPQFKLSNEHFNAGIIGYYWYAANAVSSNPSLSKFLRSDLTWPRTLNAAMDPKSWVMSDRWISGVPTAHAGYRKGLNYLMLDGSVSFIGESPRQAFR